MREADYAADTARQILALIEADRRAIEKVGRPAASMLRLHRFLQANPIISIPAAAGKLSREVASGGVLVLSDDRIVLRPEGGRVWMHGTPWHGEAGLAAPDRVLLERVYLLRQASGERLAPLGPAEAAAHLFAASFAPFHSPTGLAFDTLLAGSEARLSV